MLAPNLAADLWNSCFYYFPLLTLYYVVGWNLAQQIQIETVITIFSLFFV